MRHHQHLAYLFLICIICPVPQSSTIFINIKIKQHLRFSGTPFALDLHPKKTFDKNVFKSLKNVLPYPFIDYFTPYMSPSNADHLRPPFCSHKLCEFSASHGAKNPEQD